MTDPLATRQRWALSAFCGSSIAAFALGQQAQPAWLMLIPCLVAPFFGFTRLPSWLQRSAPWATRFALLLLGVLGMQQIYPMFSDATIATGARAAGYLLAVLCGLFLVSPRVWQPATPALLCSIGLLTAGCLVPMARLAVPIGVGSVALFVYLADPRAGWLRSLGFGASVAALAFGIARLLPWAQPLVEAATAQMINPVVPAQAGLGSSSRLGEVERLALSRTVVLRLSAPEPQKLRARVFIHFDGATWTGGTHLTRPLEARDPPARADLADWADGIPGRFFPITQAAPTGNSIKSTIVQALSTPGVLPAPRGAILGRFPEDVPVRVSSDMLLEPGAEVETYGIVNRRDDVLDASDTCADCLDVPAGLDPRIAELAARLGTGTPTPELRIERTLDLFLRNYTYALDVGAFQTRQPVAEFLFEKRRGYCEYFASAAALLLRLQGVPCRYITGFNVQDGSYQGGRYVVRESDAHAWIEAWIPARGWVELDPTPPAQYQTLHGARQNSRLDGVLEWLRTRWDEIVRRARQGEWRSLLRYLWRVAGRTTALTLVAVAALGLLWRRRGRSRRLAPETLDDREASPQVRALLTRLDAAWTQRGRPRPAWRAPLEHLEGLPPEALSPGLREASRRIVDCFYRERFARERAAAEQLRALGELLERAATEPPPPEPPRS